MVDELRGAHIRARLRRIVAACCVVAATAGAASASLSLSTTRSLAATSGSDWSSYLHDAGRSGFDSGDSILSAGNAAQMVRRWSFKTGGVVAASAAVAGGQVYVGSWDGYEYDLNAGTGALVWKTFLGTTTGAAGCNPPSAGVSSAAAVVNGVVYVGGGDAYWYALDATTGAVLWRVFTGDNSAAGGHYNWSSPLIANGVAYIGISSLGDCPLVQGELLEVDLTSHAVVATFKAVPDGQVGGGIWTSPTLDTSTGIVYATTGTTSLATQTLTQSMVALDGTTLNLLGSWQIPQNVAVADSDWGGSPTLLRSSGGTTLVAAINKNGIAYAFAANDVSAGPVWQQQVAYGGSCPTCGDGSVSSGSFGNGALYLAGGNSTIAGRGYPGSVRALDPATGTALWAHGTTSPVIAALAGSGGLVYDGAGSTLEVLDASSGRRLYSYTTGGPIYGAPAVSNGLVVTGGVDGSVNAFGLPSSPPKPPPSDRSCPAGWTCQDIGSPKPAGSEAASGSTLSVTVGGTGIGGTGDHFRLVSQPASGDVQVRAQVTSIVSAGTAAQAAVMLRQSNDPGSPEYALVVTASKQLVVRDRTTFGGSAATLNTLSGVALPAYLEIQRIGDHFQAATSSDGTTFTLVPGTDATLPMPFSLLAGVGASSALSGTAATAVFSGATVGAPGVAPAPAPAASPCPTGWQCADVGNPKLVGNQSLSGSVWTLTGSGSDVFGYADQFHFVWQQLSGDADVIAEVVSQTSTAAWAKAGVMLRQSTDPGAPEYSAFLTPGNGVVVEYRQHQGLRSKDLAIISSTTAPAFLQVARSQNVFTAYTSSDGSSWVPVAGSSVQLDISGSVLAGLAVTSHSTTSSNTAQLQDVTVAGTAPPPPNACPSGWSCADIGSPTPAGTQTVYAGTWSVEGGGTDIWSTADQFRFESQPLSGDGSITVRLQSQTFTDPWAKAGVMLRQSSDPGSAFYALLATPQNGYAVQYRPSAGSDALMAADVAGTLPQYIEVARSGTTFTAYTSNDGTTWTLVPGSGLRLGMSGTLLAGMAVTSHNTSDLSTATFDTVSLSAGVPPPPSCPGGWICTDVGDPTQVGTQTLDSNGNWTIVAGGNDIWGTSDQFHLVAQSLATLPTTVSAQVVSQTNTYAWAKAGVMVRQSSDPADVDYAVLVTPSSGITVQYRPSYGGSTVELATVPGAAPAYVRIGVVGTTFTASTSTDGVTWTPVAGSTVTLSMSVPLLAGMAAASHNSNAAANDVFAAVVLQ